MPSRKRTTVRRITVTPSHHNSEPSLPPGAKDQLLAEIDALLVEMDARIVERGGEAELAAWTNRGIKAMMLSPCSRNGLDICRALLRGERVPWNLLNYWQAERYGLRRRSKDGRYGLTDFHDVRRP